MSTSLFVYLACMLGIIAIALLVICVLSMYTIRRDTNRMKHTFEVQMASAKQKSMPEINKMPYPDLMKIVNETINYFTTQNMSVVSLVNKSPEEISILLDELSADIATRVKVSVSPYVSECITCYVTDDFYDRYIINSVRLLLVAHIEQHKRSRQSSHHNNKKGGTNNKPNRENKNNNPQKK